MNSDIAARADADAEASMSIYVIVHVLPREADHVSCDGRFNVPPAALRVQPEDVVGHGLISGHLLAARRALDESFMPFTACLVSRFKLNHNTS